MKLEDKTRTIIKRILAGLLAVIVLGLGIGISYNLTKGYGEASIPEYTPDHTEYVPADVEVPNEADTPNEALVNGALILIEVIMVVFIIYVLVRKKVG